eukprot:CAMPEP_0206576270 /NCGR_PEP_ID=MMETSP0325_2-20121206/30636_1 /ASSEMBLY_ACC=CAM_ASM_000347 /TAXON_ID=2866 /ORGANISM="Crypthecodinium cohnii, Strain Seligo" /LENGTH=76 /DNA_ID=CAMNT_0054081423 /DNA_START=30 /DNA_END=257 /DNA_ORIENTATION=+
MTGDGEESGCRDMIPQSFKWLQDAHEASLCVWQSREDGGLRTRPISNKCSRGSQSLGEDMKTLAHVLAGSNKEDQP